MKMRVRDSLPCGRENAILIKILAEVLGFPRDQNLRKQIERERATSAVIPSDYHRGKYYLSNDPEELWQFARTLNARATNTANMAQSAQEILDFTSGQERMEV